MTQWLKDALAISGGLGILWTIAMYFLNRGRRQASAGISKTERETGKIEIEKYLLELNVQKIIDEKVKLIEIEYKDIIFNMQREHFQIKKDIQGRLEKEMKDRISAEEENVILKNELHTIKMKSQDQDRKIEELTQKVTSIEKNGANH
jgi:translation elongation factor EF-1beta